MPPWGEGVTCCLPAIYERRTTQSVVCAATTRDVAVRAGHALRGREHLGKGRDKRHTRTVGTGSSPKV